VSLRADEHGETNFGTSLSISQRKGDERQGFTRIQGFAGQSVRKVQGKPSIGQTHGTNDSRVDSCG
jgi:hypothetical protein